MEDLVDFCNLTLVFYRSCWVMTSWQLGLMDSKQATKKREKKIPIALSEQQGGVLTSPVHTLEN